jgi:putative sigma-54 modulation protein
MKTRTEAIHFSADKNLLEFIDKKTSKLHQFYDKIIDVDIKLRLENSGQIRDKIAEVKVHLPGTILFVKEHDKTFETAIDASIDSLTKQLIKYKERRQE